MTTITKTTTTAGLGGGLALW